MIKIFGFNVFIFFGIKVVFLHDVAALGVAAASFFRVWLVFLDETNSKKDKAEDPVSFRPQKTRRRTPKILTHNF